MTRVTLGGRMNVPGGRARCGGATCAVILATCAGLLAATWAERGQAQNANLQGSYVNEAQPGHGIEAAIDTAIAKMNFIARPVARSRLKKTNTAHRRLTIASSALEISIAFDGNAPVRMPADGTLAKWTRDDGEVFDVCARWIDDQLVQTFKAPDGQRVNTFVPAPDGRTLNMQVEITSPQLPAPVTYALTFERQSGGQ
jgi:hypothetical protein